MKAEDKIFELIDYCTEDGKIIVFKDGKKTSGCKGDKGYIKLCKRINGNKYYAIFHRLIYRYFNNKIPVGFQVNHLNLQKDDNSPNNLEAVTPKENVKHAINNGIKFGNFQKNNKYSSHPGSENGMSKLTESQVIEIKNRLKNGELQSLIAKNYNVVQQTISDINTEKHWRAVGA